MKTLSACAPVIVLAAITVATAHPTRRHLQNFPSVNSQGQFRPGPMAPNGGFQSQFGTVPMQGNGINQLPPNSPQLGMQSVPNVGAGVAPAMGTDSTQTLGIGEADFTGAGSAAGVSTVSPSTLASSDTAGISATTTDLAQAEPTITVIFPDSVEAHTGWSSFSSDVGETAAKAPPLEKPADKPTETSSALKPASTAPAFVLVTTAMSLVTTLGLTAGGGASE